MFKKRKFILFLIALFLVGTIIFIKLSYLGFYRDYSQLYVPQLMNITQKNGKVVIEPYNGSDWKGIKRVKYFEKGNNIYIYMYEVSRFITNDLLKKEEILLSKKGTYKIYYKNRDGSSIFLKELKYE